MNINDLAQKATTNLTKNIKQLLVTNGVSEEELVSCLQELTVGAVVGFAIAGIVSGWDVTSVAVATGTVGALGAVFLNSLNTNETATDHETGQSKLQSVVKDNSDFDPTKPITEYLSEKKTSDVSLFSSSVKQHSSRHDFAKKRTNDSDLGM